MRRLLNIVLSVLLTTAVSFSVFAEEPEGGIMGKEMMKGGMMGEAGMMAKRGKMTGMCPMHAMMIKAMTGKSLIATEDGGIVVMSGNKLMKYDKDLNLVKEVELKIDMAGMQRMMMQMKEKCPMCRKMMKKCGMMGGASEGSQEPAASTEASGHKSHH